MKNRNNYLSGLKIILLLILLIPMRGMEAQVTFYDLNTIQQIEMSFIEPDWEEILDSLKAAGSSDCLMSEWVKINGIQYDSAGVKYKGSSSYDPAYIKNPFTIKLDEFKDQSHEGITSIKLANCYGDPSMIREVISYDILSNYMACSRSNFAQVYINGDYIGLYTNDESLNKKFLSAHFYSSKNTFIKCNPALPGPFAKSNFKYISADSSDYQNLYEMESDYGWNDLVSLCDAITNDPGNISPVLDIDRTIWMLAFNNVVVNLDSYNGWFSQNQHVYKDQTGHYNMIIWDLNMSLGGFPYAGTQGGGSGSLTVEGMQQLSPLLHESESDWPLITAILANPEYRRMYFAHMKTIINENFSNGNYLTLASSLQSLVDSAVQADTNKFFTYDQFLGGITTDVPVGSYTVPGIGNLMDARTSYLIATAELSAVAPVISAVTLNDPEPVLNDEMYVTAMVVSSGDVDVYLGIRFDKAEKFERITMYDDGNHNDGAAGDQVYGASFTISSLTAHYYIYAENADAGMFSPERAEYEFYAISASYPTALPGEVAINEFLAKNSSDTVNEYGNNEDWIELFNLTDETVNLFGLYLTDDISEPDKYAFPENTIIQPKSYLGIWADEEDTVSSFLHANFKLSAGGESLMLSDGAGLIIDSLTFGEQTADISMARCPNGTGSFSANNVPTFGSINNCPEYIDTPANDNHQLKIKPNPFQEYFVVSSDDPDAISAELYCASGIQVARANFTDGEAEFEESNLPAGMYFVILRNVKNEVLGSTKILKIR